MRSGLVAGGPIQEVCNHSVLTDGLFQFSTADFEIVAKHATKVAAVAAILYQRYQ